MGTAEKRALELRGRAGIEPAVGALGQPRDLTERPLPALSVPSWKRNTGTLQQCQFARTPAQIIDVFFHAIANVNEGIDRPRCRFLVGMAQYLADLRIAAGAGNARHQAGQGVRVRHPFGGPAFPRTAEVDELHFEAADGLTAWNISACSASAMSQVGCRLMVASIAKISRPPRLAVPGPVPARGARSR